MSEYLFQFAVLRYMHDPATQEFLNIGIVVYSKEARYVRASISTKYRRLSQAFKSINGDYYRRIANYIEMRFLQIHNQFQNHKLFEDLPDQIEVILNKVLPPDDSSLVFGGHGGGLTDDLDTELIRLYSRLVEKYVETDERPSRADDEVWQTYRKELDRHQITLHLSPVTIQTPTYQYEFAHAWKNERWHPIEPISLDLVHETSILDKANRWIGRAASLEDSLDIGTLYMLLAAPRRDELKSGYQKAIHNLREKIRIPLELVEEDEATEFSEKFAEMIQAH